ncbi:MAG: zf-HC2 domain-containing protein [Rhodobacterales bacterium]
MYSCKEVAMRADALLDAELGLMERVQMRFHLAMCKGCAAFVEQLRVTRDISKASLGAAWGAPENADKVAAILQMAREGDPNDPLNAAQSDQRSKSRSPPE